MIEWNQGTVLEWWDLENHQEHNLVIVPYRLDPLRTVNLSLECDDCCEVLADWDKVEKDD